jgi:hypothetical protein
MKLTLPDLDPHFLKRTKPLAFKHTDDIRLAEGLMFMCPACWWSNAGRGGTHRIIIWRPSVPPERWHFEGTGYADLTLAAPSASVSISGGCRAHFFIRRGRVDFC